jgi:hypothetical protein
MIQSTPGIFAQSDYTPSSPPYVVYVMWTIGISGATWNITFDNNNLITKTFTESFGSGESTHRNMAYFNNTMKITLSKTNNGGLAQDSVGINIYNASGPTLLDTASYVVTNNVSNVVFNLTGLSAGNNIYVSFNEG